MLGELMQMPCGIRLRGKYALHALGGQGADHAVIEHSRRVHHRAKGMLDGNRVEQLSQAPPLRYVASDDPDIRAQGLQLLPQLASTLRLRSLPADQQQAIHTVRLDQMARQQGPQGPGPTGDQDRTPGVEHRVTRAVELTIGRGACACEPRCVRRALAYGELWFACAQSRGDHSAGGLVVIDVEEGEAFGILRLCAAHQPPYG